MVNRFDWTDLRARWLPALAGVLLAFFSARIGLSMTVPGESFAGGLFWPNAGIGLAWIFLFGPWMAVPVFLGNFLAVFHPGIPLAYPVGFALAYTVSGLAGASLMRMIHGFSVSFRRIREVLGFIFVVCPLSAGISSMLAVASFFLSFSDIPWSEFRRILAPHFVGDSLGALVIGTFALVWAGHREREVRNRQFFELSLWLATLVLFGLLVFGNWAPTDTLRYPLELALFPILTWAAIRFGPRGVTTGVLIVAVMAIWQLLQVFGPEQKFISQGPGFLWAFVGVLAVTSLVLAAVFAEIQEREYESRSNANRLSAFIDAFPGIAWLVSREGRILRMFNADSALAKRKGESLVSMDVSEAFDSEAGRLVERAIETGKIQVMEYSMKMAGRRVWFEGRVSPLPTQANLGLPGEEECAIWIAHEIDERRRSEEALRYRDAMLQASSTAMNTLLTVRETEQALTQILITIGENMGASRLFLAGFEVDPRTGTPRLVSMHRWSDPGAPPLKPGSEAIDWSFEADLPGWYDIFRQGEMISGPVWRFGPPIADRMRDREVRSVAMAPVFVDSRFWGVLGVEVCEDPKEWEENELNILRLLAASIGGFLLTRKNEEALREAKTSADEANAAKSEFLAMMSHEIRTPMNAIIGFADLMNQTEMQEDQREYLSIIQRSGNALLELINNILDYSKIESRTIELDESPFNLEQVICEVLEMVMVKAQDKHIGVDYEVGGELPEFLKGDPHRMRQILLNLVNNAVKFTEEGEVWLRVHARQTPDKARTRLHFRVVDTGIGIPPSKIKKLFKPFTQVDSSTTRQFGGTGLGLVISKRLVERMDGNMWVESEEGKGSTFHFTIELTNLEDPKVAAEENRNNTDLDPEFGKQFPMRILLVEDEPINQLIAQEVFKQLGYETRLEGDGIAALERMKRDTFDLVVTDIHMPGLDGMEVTRRIRNGAAGEPRKNQYIIALTAFALDEDRKKCIAAGMNDYLSKPLQIDQLKRSLERAFRTIIENSEPKKNKQNPRPGPLF